MIEAGEDKQSDKKGEKTAERNEYGGFIPFLPFNVLAVCVLCMHFHASRRTAVCVHAVMILTAGLYQQKQDL